MNDTAELSRTSITRADPSKPILIAKDRDQIALRAGTVIDIDGRSHEFKGETPIAVDGIGLAAGHDYGVTINDDGLAIVDISQCAMASVFAGFHFAPGGNAVGADGGDTVPAIDPYSLWDVDFCPSCRDPRSMTLVEVHGRQVWVDIYLLGTMHREQGTSRFGAEIADGRSLPQAPNGEGKTKKLDYPITVEIYATHGKRLLSAEEFFAAAYGVKERRSRSDEPTHTGALDDNAARFISRFGLFDVTGTMWQWGTDGHPTDPRPSLFGGSWIYDGYAGSRYAHLGVWPENSSEDISARGACDHLMPV